MKNFCAVKAWIDHYCIEHETALTWLDFLVLIFAIVGFLGLFGIFWGIGIIIGCIAALFMSCLDIKLHKVVMYAVGLEYVALVEKLKKENVSTIEIDLSKKRTAISLQELHDILVGESTEKKWGLRSF